MIGLRPFSLNICSILLTLLCVPRPAQGFDRTIEQYVHTAWGEKEGAPSGILALAQTTDGYLWIGAVDGLYRFDGVSFELYRPGLVYALLARPNGDLWIGLYAAVVRLRNGQQTAYSIREGVPNGKVAGFAGDAEGTIWVATNAGLARLEGDRWSQVGQNWDFPGKLATGMCLDRHGTFWVATENTIVFLPGGARKFQPTGISSGEVWEIVEAQNGRLWLAETTRSVRPMPQRGSLRPSDKTEIVVGSIGIRFDREGALWISTIGSGMRRASEPEGLEGHKYAEPSEAIEAFTSKDGLTDDLVTAILEDREGDIWVGTNSGLDCFRKGELAPVVSPFPLVQPLLLARDAGFVRISSNYLMFETRGTGKSTVTHLDDNDLNLYAYRDPNGIGWWSGNGFVSRLKGGHVFRIPPKGTKAPFALFPHVTEDRDGVLWGAVQYEGIFYLKADDTWQRLETPPEIAKLDPSAAYTDWMGRVWFGFDGGGPLVTVAKRKLDVVAASGKSPVGSLVTSIQGRGKHIWIGGAKLVYFDGSNFHEVVPFDADAFKVWGIHETPDGSLWLAENRGVVHIPPPEVTKFLDNYSRRVHYDLYDSADGLPGSFHDAAARSREVEGSDGRLWFAATKGVAWLDPTSISKNTLPPPVLIRSVDADGKHYMPGASLVLPPRSKNFKIAYTALSLSVPSRVRFRYKLEGIDSDWQEAEGRREAFYTRLSPGKYRFRVIACNNDGLWNEQGAALDFNVAPAWFQTIWFRVLCIAAAMLTIWGVYRLRVRQIHKSLSARFDERLAERTRMARELHDTFLQTLQGSKLVAEDALEKTSDPVQMRRAMEQLLVWLGQAVQEGRAALNSLRTSTTQRNDLADALRRATEECRMQRPIEVSFSVSGDSKEMHPVVRDEIYRVGYEAIRNACTHSNGSRLEVELKYARDLAVLVRDNGIGIDPTVAEQGKNGHFGLQGMRERVARIGGKLTVASSADSGTQITVIVPGGIVFRKPSPSPLEKIKTILRRVGPTSHSD
jgi:signal transduction histidine kinase/ligand-binding sensor domain-containing protein